MIIIPNANNFSTNKLSQIFNNTSASYKYYWFISLIQLNIKKSNSDYIKVDDMVILMISNAWYPINYFKLNFGFSDKLQKNIFEIQKELNIEKTVSIDDLFETLKNTQNKKVKKLISHFKEQVPYRFLTPWIKYKSDRETILQSQISKNDCLYSLYKNDEFILKLNPLWQEYFVTNYKVLLDFIYWNLTLYIQSKNLNIPNVSNKLIKPLERQSLNKQRKFWNIAFSEIDSINCIYSNRVLNVNFYDMEHFIPWSFVTHNQLWNLIPADGSINSSKSNKLPHLNTYLKSFVALQREAINVVYKNQPNNKLLEDFLFIDNTIPKILELSENVLIERYKNTIEPLIQIASNSGFEFWEK